MTTSISADPQIAENLFIGFFVVAVVITLISRFIPKRDFKIEDGASSEQILEENHKELEDYD